MVSSGSWENRSFGSGTGYATQMPRPDEDLRAELRATLLAMRELGPEFDQAATDAFLDEVLRAYDRRSVQQRVQQQEPVASSVLRAGAILAGGLLALSALFGVAARSSRWVSPDFGARGEWALPHRSASSAIGAPGAPVAPPNPAAQPSPPTPPQIY